ncbi:MAG: hypothetical protein DMG39_31475 [Acidobacteria bacterium]|nr:MAG: hypothetical protein DMG39_31475 [Acidobacteriota bacterium]
MSWLWGRSRSERLGVGEGQLRCARLPRKSIEAVQVIEYLRAFLIGREAWAQGNMLTIISGAFGVFRTDLVRALAAGLAGRALAQPGHALPLSLRKDWLLCTSLMALRVIRSDFGDLRNYNGDHGLFEPGILSAIPHLRVRFATVISIGSVLPEEITYKRYNDWKDVVRLVSYCFFRALLLPAVTHDLAPARQYLRGDHEWKALKRKGLVSATAQ